MNFNSAQLQSLLDQDLSGSNSAGEYLRGKCLSKLIPTDTTAADLAAHELFLNFNERATSFVYDIDDPLVSGFLSFARERAIRMFYSGDVQSPIFDVRKCGDVGRTGPGASLLAERNNIFHKMFSGRLASTSADLYNIYRHTIYGRWQRAEEIRSSKFGVDIVQTSNMSFVPKTAKISRAICTEPGLNMFFQLGAGRHIEGMLKRFYRIDLAIQPDINRRLAQLGSIDGSYATIDLKSASDCVTRKFVKDILPVEMFKVLDFLRTPNVNIKGTVHRLHIMSTMGNGFTFPLQTLIFAMICEYSKLLLGIRSKTHVFGDDIVIESSVYELVTQLLEKLGFIVNSEKSFNEGPFRESCGHDYLHGQNIRPVFIKEVRNDSQIFSSINRLMHWSIVHRTPLPRTLDYLYQLVQRKLFVPLWQEVGAGIRCPRTYASPAWVSTKRGSGLSYVVTRPVMPKYRLNWYVIETQYDAVVIAFLYGSMTRGELHDSKVKSEAFKYSTKVTQSWDAIDEPGITPRDYEDYWFINLYGSSFEKSKPVRLADR